MEIEDSPIKLSRKEALPIEVERIRKKGLPNEKAIEFVKIIIEQKPTNQKEVNKAISIAKKKMKIQFSKPEMVKAYHHIISSNTNTNTDILSQFFKLLF